MVFWQCVSETAEEAAIAHAEVRITNCVIATQALNLLVHVSDMVTVAQNSSKHFINLFPWSSMVSNAEEKFRLLFFLQFHPRSQTAKTKRCNN